MMNKWGGGANLVLADRLRNKSKKNLSEFELHEFERQEWHHKMEFYVKPPHSPSPAHFATLRESVKQQQTFFIGWLVQTSRRPRK